MAHITELENTTKQSLNLKYTSVFITFCSKQGRFRRLEPSLFGAQKRMYIKIHTIISTSRPADYVIMDFFIRGALRFELKFLL